ncbi:flagellar biosynthesis repressor FlbT [Bradyrhizobium sp. WYCCWR 13023]|uniref:Probable flagellum biosynthesis repressor protein FlbT n=1 Tax=Bradyrhizobium zhengyangense TaxID=2911009 RepID=A0A9X1RFM1_9BRAD|nr:MULTISPECIES: flagellar biosynthesis repressor FlbT [Bradyrhizobium]MCG2629275.1 flagellar biosynthesis repressor FlbT [Bradyrhizobium zhengyangense]MCG2640742.1 flagellar biosynthesis repressor FlbT [Bradyrhizobium zhengyangense]MCG2670576.1 flagellar biosynthesis repressor FlbT [Bradyrhizobium zhengyangense]MDA9518905.1 flagellum biosynthesis protein FlbT [Bradyrhizobium sp. CCBAU 11434]
MKISLRAGERVYINGAVLRVDRKVSLELVNDVMFLLEGQVMQAADATTAMRQLYFIVQLMLMNPTDVAAAASLYGQHHAALLAVCENREMLDGLAAIDEMVGGSRYFEALKRIRALFPLEEAILAGTTTESPIKAA